VVYREAGFRYGGKAELILTICEEKVLNKLKDWYRDEKSLVYIKIEYYSRDVIDWTSFLENGHQPPNTCIGRFVAINRVVSQFRMNHLFSIGRSSKDKVLDAAGKFGEGFKVGALEAARKGYEITVEANKKRRSFVIRKNHLCFQQQDSMLSKEANEHPRLIFVRLKLRTPCERPVTCAGYKFHPFTFRLLSPGAAFSKYGATLTNAADKGSLYCMGIFVDKINDLVLGYDIPSKDFIKQRDRNEAAVKNEILHALIIPLIESASDSDKGFMSSFLRDILTLSEPQARACHEVLALFRSKELCQKLAKCFREEKGDGTFPCLESEQGEVERSFENRAAIVLPANTVGLLRKGGYKTVYGELDFIFSDANKIDVLDEDQVALVKSSLFRLNRVDECFQITRGDIVFVDGHFLSNTNKTNGDCCKLKGGKFYVNNKLLVMSESNDFLRASFKLGFTIACKVSQVQDFDLSYSDKNNFTCPFYTFELKSEEAVAKMVVCENLLQETEEVWVTQTGSSAVINKFRLAGLCTQLSNDYDPGIEYSFSAMSKEEHVFDPLTQKACVLTKYLTNAPHNGCDNSAASKTELQHHDGCNAYDEINQSDVSTTSEDDFGDDVTEEELASIFCDNYTDYAEDEEEASCSESEPEPKRPRGASAKDYSSAQFGPVTVYKGGLYNVEKKLVRVLEFTGKRQPRGAICEIICTLEAAIRHTPGLGGNQVADFQEYPREKTVYQVTQKGAKFMESLSDCDGGEDFDEMKNHVHFILKVSQDRRQSNFFVELTRHNLDPPETPPVPIDQKPREAVLFAGVGGSSEGDKQAGFDVAWLVEIDSLSAASCEGVTRML
jgi:hypothetical protein